MKGWRGIAPIVTIIQQAGRCHNIGRVWPIRQGCRVLSGFSRVDMAFFWRLSGFVGFGMGRTLHILAAVRFCPVWYGGTWYSIVKGRWLVARAWLQDSPGNLIVLLYTGVLTRAYRTFVPKLV